MTGQWDMVRAGFNRSHDSFEFPTCVFYNHHKTGVDRGQPTGDYLEIGELDCEFVPPGADSTVDTEGTHLDFTTSIRAPQSDINSLLPDVTLSEDTTIPAGETESYNHLTVPPGVTLTIDGTVVANELTDNGTVDVNGTLTVIGDLDGDQVPYGVDGERPTRVEAEGTTYELEAVVPEHGSDMRLLRLTEV